MHKGEIDLTTKPELSQKTKRPKKIVIPRREPSLVVPERKPNYPTPDKNTCLECTCFPKEDPYVTNKKLNPCQKSPLTLYELAAKVVDSLPLPNAFDWSEEDVVLWMEEEVGLPEYKECITVNHINGKRLLMLEDPSKLVEMNIRDFTHIQIITSKIRKLFTIEIVKFLRSIGLPPRKPLTHCTIFKSRTGPSWGIRKNWNRCDILRWMKVIMPEPVHMDHWDLVWYQKPEFPKVKIARVEKKPIKYSYIPHYTPQPDVCREFLIPRKFIIQQDIPENLQYIWMENIPEEPLKKVEKKVAPKKSRLVPKKISLTGLKGREFILAKRKTPKSKFLP